MAVKLSVKDSAKLLNYIINSDPVLTEAITDLPTQGSDVPKIGKIIMSNVRYKNAFINAINLIALTVIVDYDWKNPWEGFTEQGQIAYGQSVREMIVDLVEAQDYNEHMMSATDFLKTEIPDVYSYMHELNFQKFYKTSVNDAELNLAFTGAEGVYNLVTAIVNKLRQSYIYDKYLVDKYQLCRRIVDGTIPSVKIPNFDANDTRKNVAFMKEYSNNMSFMSPDYNPAGLRIATDFDNQRTIVSTGFEAKLSTEVLATSYFKDEAEMKTKLAMIDTFHKSDYTRLAKLLKDAYVPFTEAEISKLSKVVACILADNFFKDYYYALDSQGETISTEFMNPETLIRNYWLHAWRIFSTSPFANCIVFTTEDSEVNSVTVSPSTATVTKGQGLNLKAIVDVDGITNKSVMWSVDETSEEKDVTINQKGELFVPEDYTAPSGTQGVYTVEIETALANGEKLIVDGVEYTADTSSDDTTAKQATSLKTLLEANASTAAKYTITRNSATLTFTEKSGKYGSGAPSVDDSDLETGVVSEDTTTEGVSPNIIVTATSIFDKTKSGTATITVA